MALLADLLDLPSGVRLPWRGLSLGCCPSAYGGGRLTVRASRLRATISAGTSRRFASRCPGVPVSADVCTPGGSNEKP